MAAGRGAELLAGVEKDERFTAFVRLFNEERDFFECHEVMEELWLEEGRHPLLQGLLQAAVGLYHEENGNRSGAIKLMSAATEKLEPYGAAALGIDLAALCERLRDRLKTLHNGGDTAFRPFELVLTDAGGGEGE